MMCSQFGSTFLGRFLRDQRGSVLPLFGLSVVVLFGFAALGIDVSHLYYAKNELQTTADAAALAAALDLPDIDAASETAQRIVEANMPADHYGDVLRATDIETGIWDSGARSFTAGGASLNAVRITARRAAVNGNPVTTFLAGVLGIQHVDLVTEAIASVRQAAPICILVLHPTASQAFKVWGSAILRALDCAIQVNSSAGNAFSVGGNGSVRALRNLVHGGASVRDTLPAPETGMPVVPDPLASLPAPAVGSCMANNQARGTVTFQPGRYCGGINVRSNTTLTLAPGVYILDNGPFDIGSNSTVRGQGVTIYLRGANGRLNITGGPIIELSAPTSGTYAGILVYADRAQSGLTHRMRGNPDSRLVGTIYIPTGHVDFSGNSGVNAITILIANTVELTGNDTSVFKRYTEQTTVPLPPGFTAADIKASARVVQ